MQISPLLLAGGFVLYVLASRLAMRWLRNSFRDCVMALLNVAGISVLICTSDSGSPVLKLTVYAVISVAHYLLLRFFLKKSGRSMWPAFFMPIAALVVIRYTPGQAYIALGHLFGRTLHGVPAIIGISYFAFRCSRLVLEVNTGAVKMPGFCQYLSFAFFLPTMSVGPINTYTNFRLGFEGVQGDVPVSSACFRFLIGFIKFRFVGGILSQLTYAGFLLNGHAHYWVDLPIIMVCYYLFLYCNFSGFCDMAIATAALVGIPVLENFNNPFAARNIKDFWNRWHITLSQWMRDIVFAPLAKSLVRLVGTPQANHAIAMAITVVFLLVGIWHGVGWHFAIFGLVHALGLVANHYYTISLRKWLGRAGFQAYMANRWIHGVAVTVTFAYCAASLLFFANTLSQIREIFCCLR